MLTTAAALNKAHQLTPDEVKVIDDSIPVVQPECDGPYKASISVQAQTQILAVAAVLAKHGD